MFYGTRAYLQSIFTFRMIEGTYWQSPGIPSLVVPYGDASDFYYSGHTGFLTLLAIHFWKIGQRKLGFVCGLYLVYMVQILLIYRIHYSIGEERE